jgi:hypothetical protein
MLKLPNGAFVEAETIKSIRPTTSFDKHYVCVTCVFGTTDSSTRDILLPVANEQEARALAEELHLALEPKLHEPTPPPTSNRRPVLLFEPSGVSTHRNEIYARATFHQWALDYEESETGPAQYPVAIVELPDGEVVNWPSELVKFEDIH